MIAYTGSWLLFFAHKNLSFLGIIFFKCKKKRGGEITISMHICSLHKFLHPCPSHHPQSLHLRSVFSGVFTIFTQILWLHPSEYLTGCICHCCTASKQCPTVTCSKYKTTNNCRSVWCCRPLADLWAWLHNASTIPSASTSLFRPPPSLYTLLLVLTLHCCHCPAA